MLLLLLLLLLATPSPVELLLGGHPPSDTPAFESFRSLFDSSPPAIYLRPSLTTGLISMFKFLLVIVNFFMAAHGTLSTNRIRTRSLVMVWGANLKLGQSVVSTSPETVTSPKIASPGSENDNAGSSIKTEEADSAALITKIDLALRQRALLLSLQKDVVPDTVKLGHINMAVSEGLLPASFQESTVISPKLSAGGLLDEWNFHSQ